MDADRSREPVNELDVDRELQSLLAVDPSPEFVARVRTRIANEPEPSQSSVAGLQLPTWWWSWKSIAAPILAAAVIIIAVLVSRPRPIEHVPTLAATALPNTATFPPYVVSAFRRTGSAPEGPANRLRQGFGAQEAGRHVRLPETVATTAAGVTPRELETLLDPHETAALRALISGVRRGNVDLEPVLRASTPSAMELPPIAEIAIEPITIAPLVEEGVRQ